MTAVAGSRWAIQAPRPDVLVADHGQAVAVRLADGRLAVANTSRDRFAVREWLAADGDARAADDVALHEGFLCDEAGCIARLKDGARVSLVLTVEAFEEDCARAAVLVTTRAAPPFCKTFEIDRTSSRQSGAMALYRTGRGFDTVAARPPGYDRPWARVQRDVRTGTSTQLEPARPAGRDATPRAEDLGLGD